MFAGLPDLVAFLRVAVDIRNIDVEAASQAGVLVTHATPGFAVAVAEMTLGFMLDLARGISRATLAYRAGREPEPHMGRELRGAALGLIGFGVIAQELAPLAATLGMQVLASDPYRTISQPGVTQVAFSDLLAKADFVVCLAVATDETENLMDASAFRQMKRGSYFINVSRGNLVDETALEAALESGHLAGAAMDVGRAPDQKPTPRLAARADVVATPHTAGLTVPAIEHQAFETVAQVRALLAGTMPAGAVNPAHATRLRPQQR